MPASQALDRAGLRVLDLGPKDGIALMNSNAFSVGASALAVSDASAALDALEISAALSFEGFRANPGPLDPRVQKCRPAPGQEMAAARLCALLAGSALWQSDGPRHVQDPLSFRCVAPVHGALLAYLDHARHTVEVEINSGGDNPVVLADGSAMLSTGNFDITALTLELERLGQALTHAASLCVDRTLKMMSPRFSDLPRFLSPLGPTRTGFATVQKTIAALEADIRHLALPVSFAVRAVADGVEDHASMAPRVVEKASEIVGRLRWLIAIELMVAAQALDLRRVRLGAPMQKAYDTVRAAVPMLREDRATGPDIERIRALIDHGSLGASAPHAVAVGIE